jgi:hippurate hydrolase
LLQVYQNKNNIKQMRFTLFFFFLFFSFLSNAQPQSIMIDKMVNENAAPYFEIYKQLHATPELSTKEINTAAFLKNTMKNYGFEIIDSLGFQSFAAVLKNGKGLTILYRTDMDGLPIKEETSLSFASKTKGKKDSVEVDVMHACGHDIHMTTWLGIGKILSSLKNEWKGTLVMLAQSAEETGQGAYKVITSSNYNKIPKADFQLAIHDHAELKTGEFGFCDEYSMAAVDMMNITIFGKGGHGAAPQSTIDPIVISAEFITMIQTIISRNLPPTEPAVITVGAINGGTVGNAIPDQVTLKLTIRSFSKTSRNLILNRIKQIGDNLALSAGLDSIKLPKYQLLDVTVPVVYNNIALGNKVRNSIKNHFGDSAVVIVKPVTIGEDFGVYGQTLSNIPSYIIWAGTLNKSSLNQQKTIYSLHSSHFQPDAESAIPQTIKVMSNCLIDIFKNN